MANDSVRSIRFPVKLVSAIALAVLLVAPMQQTGAQEADEPSPPPPAPTDMEPPADEPPIEQPPIQQPPAEEDSEAERPPEEEWVELNFPPDTDIKTLIQYVGMKLGLRFLYDNRLEGAVTLEPNQRIPVSELYETLETVLHYKGFTMQRRGQWVRIYPGGTAITVTPVYTPDQEIPPTVGQTMVTKMVKLQHADPQDIQDVLTLYLSEDGNVMPMPDQDLIVIFEYKSRLEELRRIIRLLDVPTKPIERRIIELQYTKAPDLAFTLANIMAARAEATTRTVPVRTTVQGQMKVTYQRVNAPPGSQPFIDVDERTNRLIMIGSEDDLRELEALVEVYDVPRKELQEIQFYPLTYLSAEDAQRTIIELGLAGEATAAVPRPRTRQQQQQQAQAGGVTGGTGADPKLTVLETSNILIVSATPEEHGRIAEYLDSADKRRPTLGNIRIYTLERRDPEETAEWLSGAMKGETVNQRTNAPVPGAEGAPTIVAVPPTNSLLVNAQPEQHEQIEKLLRELDAEQPQVLLEATLIEVVDEDSFDVGLELENRWISGDPADGKSTTGSTSFGFSPRDPTTGLRVLTTAEQSAFGTGGSIAFLNDNIVNVLLRVLQQRGNSRVLSKPRILVNDNQEGTIQNVQQEPVTSTDVLADNTTATTFARYEDAGTTLTITPHISDGDFLRLKIEANVENFTASSAAANIPPPKATRTLNSEITVPDGRTIVIGGLTGKRKIESEDGIPVLMDLPLLGPLFKRQTSDDQTTTLYLFVKASILRDPTFQDLYDETQRVRDILPSDLQELDPTLTTEAAQAEAERMNEILRRRERDRKLRRMADEAPETEDATEEIILPEEREPRVVPGLGESAPPSPPAEMTISTADARMLLDELLAELERRRQGRASQRDLSTPELERQIAIISMELRKRDRAAEKLTPEDVDIDVQEVDTRNQEADREEAPESMESIIVPMR